jgi:CubicO group peptidase (beta-lactamase class C family)
MSSRGRSPWLLVLLAPLLLAAVVASIWVYVSLTEKPLYDAADRVPSVTPAAHEHAGAVALARQAVRESVAEQNLPGVSVAVGVRGEIVWAEGFGYANLWRGERASPEHRFRIGTASTLLASVAAGLLIEQGRLRIDEEIQHYVPWFPRKQWPITVRALMGHTAGLADDGLPRREHCTSAAEALQRIGDPRQVSQPGSGFRPSLAGWMLVSAAMEAAAGQPFPDLIRELVLDPLQMRATIVDPGPDPALIEGEDPPPAILFRELISDPEAELHNSAGRAAQAAEKLAACYAPRFRKNPRHGRHMMRLMDCSCLMGAGAYWSTPSDLVRLAMAVIGGRLLRAETVDLLSMPQCLSTGELIDDGLGWQTWSVPLAGKPVRAIGLDGVLAGAPLATVIAFPDPGLAVAVAANILHADTHSIAVKVAQAFADHAAGGQGK